MSRAFRIALLVILLAVLAGILWFPALRRQVQRAERQEQSEEVARREVIHAVQDGQNQEKVAIYWLSADNPRELAPVETPLALGSDPAQRARVALEALITRAPAPEQRPLPLGTTLQAFYLLDDGTAVADFSDTLSHDLPAGISTEQLAVDAIVRTLHAAAPQARRLRILIAGQEAETLAGHVDLAGAFDLASMGAPARTAPQGPTPPAASTSTATQAPTGEKKPVAKPK